MEKEALETQDNIVDDIRLVVSNIPQDLSTIEKLRWIYIKMGEVFSYDYRVVTNPDYAKETIDFSKNYISRYQTCVQISKIMNSIYNQVEGCQSRIIERKTDTRGRFGVEHVANEVTLDTGEKYILDLTVDLYLIQSGCMTKQFGYTTDMDNTQDIISSVDCEAMDQKMGLMKNDEYTDKKIEKLQDYFKTVDFSKMTSEEEVKFKIQKIAALIPHFKGYHEGKAFVDKLFHDMIGYSYKEFNLVRVTEEETKLYTCFRIYANEEIWYIYDRNLGIIKTTKENIDGMLKSGWTTKSTSLEKEVASKTMK